MRLKLSAFTLAMTAAAISSAFAENETTPNKDLSNAVLAAYYETKTGNHTFSEKCFSSNPDFYKDLSDQDIYYASKNYGSRTTELSKSDPHIKRQIENISKIIGFLPSAEDIEAKSSEIERLAEGIKKVNDPISLIPDSQNMNADEKIEFARITHEEVIKNDPNCKKIENKLPLFLSKLKKDEKFLETYIRRSLDDYFRLYESYRSSSGYGKAHWGMAPKEVARAEGFSSPTPPHRKNIKIGDYTARADYFYVDNRLYAAQITTLNNCRLEGCYQRFNEINGLLAEKYGQGESDITIDEDAQEKASPLLQQISGDALRIFSGIQSETYTWRDSETVITSNVIADDEPIIRSKQPLTQVIRYESIKLKPRADFLEAQKERTRIKKKTENL